MQVLKESKRMVFERPKKQGQSKPLPLPTTQKPSSEKSKKIITVGGGNSSGGGRSSGSGGGNGGGNGGKNPPHPSPWLDPDNEPNPAATASFVEYLRWMREPDSDYKDPTKVQILQMAQDGANYSARLTQLTKRTELIAGKENTFQVKCSWRIRVGGHRGPESILLPAFDALGMPYIPSSTLRGVARCQAIREIMATEKMGWKEAEKRVAPYFGSLDAENERDRSGKVVFLDAYPLSSQSGGLAVDMANNIWSWEGNSLKYSPNPNPFLSLKEPTFLIGLRLVSACSNPEILKRVKQWLIAGLQSGIGSQVNTGYGELIRAGVGKPASEFFSIEFSLEGQLIHGRQKFTQWQWNDRRNQWQMRGLADAEVRPVAFKSMLRYWFRSLALGLLDRVDQDKVKEWEAKLFGAITPQQRGWVKFEIREGRVTQREPRPNFQGKDDACGEQVGNSEFGLLDSSSRG
jgi:CRISPR-associated protein Cmr6